MRVGRPRDKRRGGPVPASDLEALREAMRHLICEYQVSWGDIAEACGYGRDNPTKIKDFVRGKSGMLRVAFADSWHAVHRFPEGWRFGAQYGEAIAPGDLVGTCESMSERHRREAYERTDAMKYAVDDRGMPHPSNRAAWEAYWLEREKPALDGRRHRATPLSRQVA